MRDPDEPEPPPRTYGFKPKEFERLNVPTPSEPPPPSAKDLAVLAGQSSRKPTPPGSTSGSASPPPPAAGPIPGDPNDVYSIRREVRAREQADGGDVVQIKKVRSRRKRDYWLLLITSNVLFGTVTVMGITQRNPMLLAYGLAGVVIVSLGLTWIMWFVMSDY